MTTSTVLRALAAVLRSGSGVHRLTRAYLKEQRNAARAECRRLRARLSQADRTADELSCALIKVSHELDTAKAQLTTARQSANELRTRLHHQVRRVDRRNADIARLSASLSNCRQALAAARPRITVAPVPRVPPYAPMHLPYPAPAPQARTTLLATVAPFNRGIYSSDTGASAMERTTERSHDGPRVTAEPATTASKIPQTISR